MKTRLLILIIFLCGTILTTAQVAINKDGSAPNSSAILDVQSSNQGFLLPRMSDTEKDVITNPAEGLLIYNTTTKTLNLFKEGKWHEFTGLQCVPQPSTANAGANQTVAPYSTFLGATAPVKGTGAWSVLSGIGGTIITPSSPASQFTGLAGAIYLLRWTVSTVCSSNYDDVGITFHPDCNNNAKEGSETDIDCGGGYCPACSYGLHCLAASDCQGYPNSVPACIGTLCSMACNPGYGNCDNNYSNGCETNVTNNVNHCGACNNVCSFANATFACMNSTCVMGACNIGWGDCDGNMANGCETNTATSVNHCGGCNIVCSFANATAACVNSMCTIQACNPGYMNCDGMVFNGCETNIYTNVNHCGYCNLACAPVTNGYPLCISGNCSFGCNPGYHPAGGQCVPD